MMNTTTTIDKATNNQNAFNYAVYMMLGSYFKQMEAVSCLLYTSPSPRDCS